MIVTVEADALLEMIASDEKAEAYFKRRSPADWCRSDWPVPTVLSGDAAQITRTSAEQLVPELSFVVSLACAGSDWVWPTMPRSVVMRSDVDGVHFSPGGLLRSPHNGLRLLRTQAHHPRWASLHSRSSVAAIRALDAQGAQDRNSTSRELWSCGVYFAQDCVSLERRNMRARETPASQVANRLTL